MNHSAKLILKANDIVISPCTTPNVEFLKVPRSTRNRHESFDGLLRRYNSPIVYKRIITVERVRSRNARTKTKNDEEIISVPA